MKKIFKLVIVSDLGNFVIELFFPIFEVPSLKKLKKVFPQLGIREVYDIDYYPYPASTLNGWWTINPYAKGIENPHY